MNSNLFVWHARLGQRWGWWAAVPLTLFWTFLWPVGLIWAVASLISWHGSLDKSPEAVAKRRKTWRANTVELSQTHEVPPYMIYLAICWLPLVVQGVVPITLKLAGVHIKAVFVAFYLPGMFQWPFMIAMVTLGTILLGLALHGTSLRRKRNKNST